MPIVPWAIQPTPKAGLTRDTGGGRFARNPTATCSLTRGERDSLMGTRRIDARVLHTFIREIHIETRALEHLIDHRLVLENRNVADLVEERVGDAD